MKQNEISKFDKYVLSIISAGLEGNVHKVELSALSLSRIIKSGNPEVSAQIVEAISQHTLMGGIARGANKQPVPVDSDSQLEMANIILPDSKKAAKPILNNDIESKVKNFLDERDNVSALLEKNILPSNSILLIGQPGTGKTMLAKYIAAALNKTLVVLDLSTSISSLLGKTGANLKRVLTYAKNTSSVLLLDEFDAIAKRRDDSTDLGEIKRVVNVLLMELENWPISSIVIATSNHPELLDRAIWRRFEHVIEISMPQEDERGEILTKELNDFFTDDIDKTEIVKTIASFLEGKSAADICRYANNLKRRMILKKEGFLSASLGEIGQFLSDKKARGRLCSIAKEKLGDMITVRDLATITGLSVSGVQHHLSKKKDNG